MELTGENWNTQDSIAFLQAVEGLGAEEIAALMTDLEKMDPNDVRRYRLCNALMNRWATIDPDGAWDAAVQFKSKKSETATDLIGDRDDLTFRPR